ncbi:MAG TPA: hypothetical protein VHG28_16750, partial [Longimicrobiaceae bacterium]|nr:hypothetical protein [Longimicrobiaceae bacterium]
MAREGGHHLPRPEAVDLLRGEEQAREAAMLHQHALGGTGGAGGVQHVRQVLRPGGRRGRGGALPQVVEEDHVPVHDAPGEGAQEALPGHDQRGARVAHDKAQALGRVRRVHRDVRAPGLPDPQQARQQLRGAIQAEADPHLRPHPAAPEVVREPVGPAVQLRIGERLAAALHRHGVRGAPRLRLD